MLSIQIGSETYQLQNPRSISRKIHQDTSSNPQAFSLPTFQSKAVEGGDFVGDTSRGGSCNVNVLSFTPHNLTHIETPHHVITHGLQHYELPRDTFFGLACLLDLSQELFEDNYIHPQHLSPLDSYPEATILVLKTPISSQDAGTDFTGTDPLSLHPSTTLFLSDKFPHIRLLVLDLPSADKEADGGKLLAHRNFFQTSQTERGDPKALVELAHLPQEESTGYCYLMATPARIESDAIITDLVIFDLIK